MLGALVALAALAAHPAARAEADSGEYSALLRFSSDGARILLGVCDMNTDATSLEVRDRVGQILEQATIDGSGASCVPEVFERAADGTPEVAGLLQRHALDAQPHRGGMSRDGTRYVGVDDEKEGMITLFLVDALGLRKLKYAAALRTDMGTNAYAAVVSWAPGDAYAVVTGSRAMAEADGARRWEPVVLRVTQASRLPRAKVDAASLARTLNGFGYRAYKRGDHLKAQERYAEAVALAPTFETAVYNLACMEALAGKRTAALATLRRLRALGTAAATDKLGKAPKDPDFRSIRSDPEFLELTGQR